MKKTTPALTTKDVARISGLSIFTVHDWVRTGRVAPSIAGPRGHRVPLLWSVADAVEVRTLADLRRAGVTGQKLRKVQEVLASRGASVASSRLLVADGVVHLVDAEGVAEAVLDRPGQTVLPAHEVTEHADTLLVVDLEKVRTKARALSRPTSEVLHDDLQLRGRRAG